MAPTTELGARRLRSIVPAARIVAGAFALMLLAFINGRPFLFWDTASYLALGDLLVAADPHDVIVSLQNDPSLSAIAVSAAEKDELLSKAAAHLGARSVSYSLFVRLGAEFISLWGVAFLQCLLTSALIYLLLGRILRRDVPALWFVPLMAAISLVTPAGVTSTVLLPDALTAAMILAIASLLIFWKDLSNGVRVALAIAILLCAMTHASHSLILVGSAIAGGAVVAFRDRSAWAIRWPAALLVCTAALALLTNALLGVWAADRLGEKLERPPMLSARIIDDGPGRTLLANCEPNKLALCNYADRVLADEEYGGDTAMWGRVQDKGVYFLEGPEVRRAMREEELEFVKRAVLADPVGQVGASIKNVLKLIVGFRVDGPGSMFSFNYGAYEQARGWDGANLLIKYLPNSDICRNLPQNRCGAVPIARLWPVHYAVIVAAIGAFAWLAFRRRKDERGKGAIRFNAYETTFLVIVAAILSNDVVSGVLAGAHERYQSRVIWILAALSAAILLDSLLRKTKRPATEAL